ncbi:MAG: substrate-binding domain-containing protein [Tissierellia bacterium]|nr:substrate-binding domain-containing protein [Tissierellia bacterium]
MKCKRFLSLILILILSTSLLAGCTPKEETDSLEVEENTEETSEGTTNVEEENEEKNPMIAELEDVLMGQLDPMPKLNNGEKIGVMVSALANPFWANMKDKYEKAGEELGIDVEVFAAAKNDDTTGQLETLDGLIVKDYDAIVFSPIDANNLIPGLVRANQAGVPVINLGPGVNLDALTEQGGHLDGIITVDFENQGKMVAEDMLKQMPEGGKVAIIQGMPGAGQSEGRTKGAKEVFENTDGIELVSILPGNWDRNTAYNLATDLIQAHPDLKGIFACNDVMALAAVEALETAGKRDGVIIYGVDFTEEAGEAIKAGRYDGTITYSPSVYTKAALLLSLKVVQGHEIPEKVYSPLVIVNKDNIDEFHGWE